MDRYEGKFILYVEQDLGVMYVNVEQDVGVMYE